MKVFWTKFALSSLESINRYYKENVSYSIANNIKNGVLSSSFQLEKQPLSGHIEELLLELEEGHRYILRGNYKVIYKIQGKYLYN